MAEREMLCYWVWMAQVFGAGSLRAMQYLQACGSPKAVYEAFCAGELEGITPREQNEGTKCTPERAERIVQTCISGGIQLLTCFDPEYPQLLLEISAPPIMLTAQGNLGLLNCNLTLAVVGTRHPSPYSERVVRATVQGLGRNDFVIVSGFAKGIDSAAHVAALDAGYGTIAVLGCGINVDYPKDNSRLRERMLTSGRGLLLSEYLPGERPNPANFPKRNRILSGIAQATAVIEAAYGSGSLLTAECAADQGRCVLCVPPADLFDKRYRGVFSLLRNGALPLLSSNDVLAIYFDGYGERLRLAQTAAYPTAKAVYEEEQPEKKKTAAKLRALEDDPFYGGRMQTPSFAEDEEEQMLLPEPEDLPPPDRAPQTPQAEKSAPQNTRTDLPDSEAGAEIVRFLREHGGTDADTLAEVLDIDLSTLLSTLTLLELEGFVTSLFGKQYYPAE